MREKLFNTRMPQEIPRTLGIAVALIFFIFIIPTLLYIQLGHPKLLFSSSSSYSTSDFKKSEIGMQNIPELTQKLQHIVAQNPQDVQGWYLLGRLCFGTANYSCAVHSFAHAYHLRSNDSLITLQYAQALYYQNNHHLNPFIKKLLQQILNQKATDPAANNLLAIASFEQQDYHGALKYWSIVKQSLDPNSEDDQAVSMAMANARRLAKIKKRK